MAAWATGSPPSSPTSEDGEALWFSGMVVTIKAADEQTGGWFSRTERFAPRGVATPLHVHPEDDESFYAIVGELTFYLEERPTHTGVGWLVRPRPRRSSPCIPDKL